MVFSNYRPVSMLPVFSKLLERLVYNRLISQKMVTNYHMNISLGFQKGKSTHLAKMMLVGKIRQDQDESGVDMFLDLSKAFDTIDHNV